MRKLIVSEFMTLDGVMQAPGNSNEDRRGGFEYGGWQVPYFDEIEGKVVLNWSGRIRRIFVPGEGHMKYLRRFGQNQPSGDIWADLMNSLPKYVVSTTLNDPLKGTIQWSLRVTCRQS